MDNVFHALAHKIRREILDRLRDQPGSSVGKTASAFDVSRIAVMNHIAVLEQAGLVISEREGRTRRLYLNAVPIRQIQERWIDTHTSEQAGRLTAIKHAAEAYAKRRKDHE